MQKAGQGCPYLALQLRNFFPGRPELPFKLVAQSLLLTISFTQLLCQLRLYLLPQSCLSLHKTQSSATMIFSVNFQRTPRGDKGTCCTGDQ